MNSSPPRATSHTREFTFLEQVEVVDDEPGRDGRHAEDAEDAESVEAVVDERLALAQRRLLLHVR